MKRKSLLAPLTAGILILLTSPIPFAQGGADVDVTGTWIFQVETDAGGGTPTVTFEQDGERLSGHYSSMTFGEVDFTGSVMEGNVTFSFTADALGMSIEVTYAGTIEGADQLIGTIDIAGLAGGTFTAARQPAP